jgi:hypothetical protein
VHVLTAVPQVAVTHSLAGHSDRPEGWDRFRIADEAVAARVRSETFSLQHAGLPNIGHGNRQSAAEFLQECYCTSKFEA